ncbi:alpha-hydroxy acid oxidase [Modestobacter roseus]|uniref:alpha-hydroxy acid oxidase n=1 Tax=Modestobacter roseus TaxID=1181884 RepID=UPI0034E02D5E
MASSANAATGPGDPDSPPLFLDLAALEEAARQQLPAAVHDYYAGGAGAEITLGEATAAWRGWRLRPRVLRGDAPPRLATTLLGEPVATPVGVAPWGFQAMAHPDGERATARGAAEVGALMTVSTSANTALADVAAVTPAGPRWFQLYQLHSREYTDDLARRAGAAGYTALVLTVDVPVLGRRLRDLRNGFDLPAGLLMANHPGAGGAPVSMRAAESPAWTSADIRRLADLSGLPVVVKGVLRGDDAVRCVQAGAAAVWVSTHGGRQADPVVASADALPEVVDAVAGEVEVYVDGGIRAGSDVLVALALGARAVFVARPTTWGLAAGGADGVARVLGGLTGELSHTMVVCGLDDVRSVPRDTVVRAGRPAG